MENLRLGNNVLIRTCSCGIVFETYDPKKMYHSNKCGAIYGRKRNGNMIVQRKRTKSKEA